MSLVQKIKLILNDGTDYIGFKELLTCDLFAFICYLKNNLTKKRGKLVKLLENGG